MGIRHVAAARAAGLTVCGIADRNATTLEKLHQDRDLTDIATFSDASAMLRELAPTAVVVATTAPAHCQYVLAAVDSGARYVLSEKPMANSLTEADRMIDACRRARATLAVNHQMRFMPQYTRVKELIGSEQFGPLVSVLVAGSNFGLAMNVSHYFEMFRFLTNAPVERISAWFDPAQLTNPRGAEFDDRSGRLFAVGRDGCTLYIDFAAEAGHGLQCVYVCRFGQIVVDELSGHVRTIARKAEYRDLPTTRYGMPADVREFAIEPVDTVVPTTAVWHAMLTGSAYPNGADGLHALTCLVAAHASHQRQGQPVSLSDPQLLRERRFKWA
jgi:predicted dehydrogenase